MRRAPRAAALRSAPLHWRNRRDGRLVVVIPRVNLTGPHEVLLQDADHVFSEEGVLPRAGEPAGLEPAIHRHGEHRAGADVEQLADLGVVRTGGYSSRIASKSWSWAGGSVTPRNLRQTETNVTRR